MTERSSGRENAEVTDSSKPRAPFAPWDRRDLPGLFSVEETARRVGNYKWAEMRLFEVLGGWVATVPELDVKLVLGTAEESEVPMPLASLLHDRLLASLAKGRQALDWTSLAISVSENAGLR